MLRRLDAGHQDHNPTPNRKNTMNTIPFTKTDVDRVTDLLNTAWHLIGMDFDARFAAVDMLHQWTEAGRPASDLSPLRFRGVFGTAALRDILFDNIITEDDEDDTPEVPGDVYETDHGLTVVTPHGRWGMTHEQALRLVVGLAAITEFSLTKPNSAEDPSTILTRGRQLRRPVDQTDQLATVSDFHA